MAPDKPIQPGDSQKPTTTTTLPTIRKYQAVPAEYDTALATIMQQEAAMNPQQQALAAVVRGEIGKRHEAHINGPWTPETQMAAQAEAAFTQELQRFETTLRQFPTAWQTLLTELNKPETALPIAELSVLLERAISTANEQLQLFRKISPFAITISEKGGEIITTTERIEMLLDSVSMAARALQGTTSGLHSLQTPPSRFQEQAVLRRTALPLIDRETGAMIRVADMVETHNQQLEPRIAELIQEVITILRVKAQLRVGIARTKLMGLVEVLRDQRSKVGNNDKTSEPQIIRTVIEAIKDFLTECERLNLHTDGFQRPQVHGVAKNVDPNPHLTRIQGEQANLRNALRHFLAEGGGKRRFLGLLPAKMEHPDPLGNQNRELRRQGGVFGEFKAATRQAATRQAAIKQLRR